MLKIGLGYNAIEERMMSEYIAKYLRSRRTYTHVRLGMPKGLKIGDPNWEYERRIKMPTLLEADLIVRMDDLLVVIEFKVRRFQEAIGKLLQYAILVPETPEFQDWPASKISLRIVFGRPESRAEDLARRLGIEVEQFEPPWLQEMIAAKSGGPI
jgi:hypothetical protein